MSDVQLEVSTRDTKKEKNNQLRRDGFVPAIVYGHGVDNVAIKFKQNVFLKKLHGHLASNIFIDIKIDGEKESSKTVFIKDLQRDVFSINDLLHVDFMEIKAGEIIDITVPITLDGHAVGVTQDGGILEFHLRNLEVECLPRNVPKEIKVDISNMGLGDSFHAGDLAIGADVKLITAKDATVVSVTERQLQPDVEETKAEEATEAADEEAPQKEEEKKG